MVRFAFTRYDRRCDEPMTAPTTPACVTYWVERAPARGCQSRDHVTVTLPLTADSRAAEFDCMYYIRNKLQRYGTYVLCRVYCTF